jgi:hypothetical protein
MYYLTDTDPHPEGWGGVDSGVGSDGAALLAIDYKTGKTAWRHEWPSGGGSAHMLTTAGKLLFTHNGQNVISVDPANGQILWHSTLMAGPSAGPTIGGRQAVPADLRRRQSYAFTVISRCGSGTLIPFNRPFCSEKELDISARRWRRATSRAMEPFRKNASPAGRITGSKHVLLTVLHRR